MSAAPVDRAWLHRFALSTRGVTLSTISRVNTCVLSTRIGLAVLEAVGVPAIAQPVFVTVYNREGWRLTQERVPVDEWPEDAHSVGVDPQNLFKGGGGWNGHLVLVIRVPGQPRTLIDLTADQFDRPAKGMLVGGPVFMDIAPDAVWSPRDPLFTMAGTGGDLLVSYRPMPPGQSAARVWRDSPDWNVSEDRLAEFVEVILELTNETERADARDEA